MAQEIKSELLSAREGAKILGVGLSTFWRLAAKGKVPQPIKIGGSTRWRRADIEALYATAE